jgi:hypothetical protein
MDSTSNKYELVYFFSKFWWGMFIGLSIVISLVLLLLVFFPMGWSMASDTNFGLIALLSGLVSDQIFKLRLKKQMLISEKLAYSILYVWIPLCFYIMLFHPFEG